ncbi:MAG: endonuclease [Bacteroidales bacterium]|nr:endonuclease [Bacteroidales bacterium]MDY4849749.1 endonuclease [Paludibacteraceae bacterium]
MKRNLILLFSVVVSVCCVAGEMPDGYYNAAAGKSDAELKGTLKSIIRNHTVLNYGSGENSSWYCFYYSDRDTNTNLCMDMYCDDWKPFTTPGEVVAGCNVEHSFAKSWWGGAKVDAYKDCYHLNPSNSTANSARGNYPLGNVDTPTKTVGSLKIGQRHHDGLNEDHYIWEPKDEYKGDFARAYFYMATCYGKDLNGNPDSQFSAYNGWRLDNKDVGSRYAMQNDTYLEFQDWEIEVLIQWHRQDPVSSKEIDRADAVNNFQHNRNPFIDYPCLAEYIWGNKKGEPVDFATLKFTRDDDYLSLPEADKCGCNSEITEPTITAPRNGSSIDFGTAGVGETVTKTIAVKGVLLTKGLSVQIVGSQADAFGVEPTAITAGQALNGIELVVEFTPSQLGQATAQLVISSSELARSTTVNLTAMCGFHALPATNVTAEGFTANWVNGGVESYSLDVFKRQVSGVAEVTLLEDACNQETTATTAVSVYYDIDGCVRLGSGSKVGSLTYNNLDLSKGGSVVVNAKYYNTDEGTQMKITAGSVSQTFTLTNAFADYVLPVEAAAENTSVSVVIESVANGKRVNVNNVKVIGGGENIVQVSLDGFPVSVSGLSYDVAAAVSDDDPLYYTVTPQGGATSNEIVVKLTQETAISVPTADMPVCVARDGRIECNVAFRIFDLVGRDVTAANGSLCGIYIVRTAQTVQKVIVTK